MNEPPLESFLARLYTDPAMRARFLADPSSEAEQAGLSLTHRAAVLKIDPIELRLATRSFAHKRHKRANIPPAPTTLVQRWIGKFRKSARRPV
jgi:hypothetical protein